MSTAGARWVAMDRAMADAGPETGQGAIDTPCPMGNHGSDDSDASAARWSLTDCMSDRALVEWWMVLREFGVE